MSRIGRQPITMPSGVSVTIEGRKVSATGPKGTLSLELLPYLKVEQEGELLVVSKTRNNPSTQQSYGLTRTLISNLVTGVSDGYTRQLEINGVGYKAAVAGKVINLALGFSHPIEFNLPEGIEAKMEKNILTISGADKQAVGQVAANIRALKKPEPYKGKGIKYIEEKIRRKAGKTAAKA